MVNCIWFEAIWPTETIFKCLNVKRVSLLILVSIFPSETVFDLRRRSNGCWPLLDMTLPNLTASTIRNKIIYFLTRCNCWKSIKSTPMRRNANELTENDFTSNKSTQPQLNSTELRSAAISCNSQFVYNVRWEREIDTVVTANEPIIVIQLKTSIRILKKANHQFRNLEQSQNVIIRFDFYFHFFVFAILLSNVL